MKCYITKGIDWLVTWRCQQRVIAQFWMTSFKLITMELKSKFSKIIEIQWIILRILSYHPELCILNISHWVPRNSHNKTTNILKSNQTPIKHHHIRKVGCTQSVFMWQCDIAWQWRLFIFIKFSYLNVKLEISNQSFNFVWIPLLNKWNDPENNLRKNFNWTRFWFWLGNWIRWLKLDSMQRSNQIFYCRYISDTLRLRAFQIK